MSVRFSRCAGGLALSADASSLLTLINRRSLIASGVAVLSGCSGPLYRYRYKLTLEVEADGRTIRGANVVQIDEQAPGPNHLPTEMVQTRVTGEASVIDLGARGLLIALLTRVDPISEPGGASAAWRDAAPTVVLQTVYATPRVGMDEAGVSPGMEALVRQRGVREIDFRDLPTLVTFRDPKNPATVQSVDPENLAATFGTSVRLRRAMIEITDERITRGVFHYLPWLRRIGSRRLDGDTVSSHVALANTLSSNDFFRKGY